ncbi:MAG: hypothetical protein P8X64_08660 [Anaerolineales bacterium]|jgi:hypothetical protein
MDSKVNLGGLTRRTRRMEFEDGLNDMQNAIVFALVGLLGAFFLSPAGIRFYMRALLANRELTLIALIGMFGLFVLVTFGARRAIMAYRRRVLWKDKGTIEPLRWQVDSRASVLAGAVWLVVTISGLVLFLGDPMDLDSGMRVVVAAGGVATGLIYFVLGHTLNVPRYRWVGVIAGVLSAGLIPLPLTGAASWLVFAAIWTSVLLISGLSALRRTLGSLERSEA